MKVDKYNSWKEKIDPAFDDLIKVHLGYIERTHICITERDRRYKKYKRYLFLDEESLKVLEHKGHITIKKSRT